MIMPRPTLACLCTLLACPTLVIVGRSESEIPADVIPVSAHAPAEAKAVTTAPQDKPEPEPVPPAAESSNPGVTGKPLAAPAGPNADAPPGATAIPGKKPASAAPQSGAPVHATDDAHDEVNGLQKLGLSLTERSDWDAAEIAFRQILTNRSANADNLAKALIGLARVYRRQGSFTKAAAIYERFLKDYPAHELNPDALLELGRTHRALGANQLAIARFYSVINSTLKLSAEGFTHYQMLAKTAQFEIAETHFQQGNYTEANKFFSRLRLLDLAPADRARAHFKSAYALYLGKDLEAAVTTLHSYLEQWPQDENMPEARYLLSLSLRSLDRKQEALDATLELLRSQHASGEAKRWAYWQRRTGNQLANDFFQNGDTHNALVIYQGLAALSPDSAWSLPIKYQIGLCYERMRMTDRALAAYQSIVDYTQAPPAAGEPPALPVEAAKTKPVVPAKPVNIELTELARMAAWRIGQLNWHEQTERQLTSIFLPTPEPVKAPVLPPQTPSPIINIPASSPAPSGHDQSGNPATASSGL